MSKIEYKDGMWYIEMEPMNNIPRSAWVVINGKKFINAGDVTVPDIESLLIAANTVMHNTFNGVIRRRDAGELHRLIRRMVRDMGRQNASANHMVPWVADDRIWERF